MKNQYTVEYFTEKFTNIPEENWFIGDYVDHNDPNRCCAIGHCGIYNEEAATLIKMFNDKRMSISKINDGKSIYFKQDTPKKRILAALEQIARSGVNE